jgi:adenylyl cyclase-associated protein
MARLEGTKWFVGNLEGKTDVVVNVTEPKQSVFVSKIKDSVVTIKGKCTAISVENATGSGVIFDDVVATVEVINSKKVQIQANGSVHQIALDKTHGASVFLQTPAGQSALIATSLTSEINIVTPGKTEDDDAIEHAVPEQFISKFVNGKLVTGPSEHV